jgi:hypothetical protein
MTPEFKDRLQILYFRLRVTRHESAAFRQRAQAVIKCSRELSDDWKYWKNKIGSDEREHTAVMGRR